MGGEWGVSWLSVTLVRCREVELATRFFCFFLPFRSKRYTSGMHGGISTSEIAASGTLSRA